MDKLTLEHLAPYLPYGAEVKTEDGIFKVVGWVDGIGICLDTIFYGADAIPEYKLILRPLSYLTKEIQHNGNRFVPISAILERFGDSESLENALLWLMNGSYPYFKFSYCIIELLISWHFDVFGLIEKGLAIDYNIVKGGPNEI